jgi:uncharacterized membrane protein YphA (DoxX/SURF4 family)
MDLGKKWRSNDADSIAKQLEETKKKEAELLKKLEEQKEHERKEKERKEQEEKKQRELEEQKENERKLLEDDKKRKEHMEAELAKTKEKEEQLKQEQLETAQKEKDEQDKQKKLKNMVDTSIRAQTKKEHPEGCLCGRCKKMRKKIRSPKIGKSFNFGKIISGIKNISKNGNEQKPNAEGAIDTKVQPSIFTDITVLGLRLAIGFSFIVHGLSKLDEGGVGFAAMLTNWGMPPELALPIGYIELLAGIFLTVGILTRISSIAIGVIMLGAIFAVKGATALIGQGGVELDLIILGAVALLGIFGPGRFSIANIGIKGLIFDRKLH